MHTQILDLYGQKNAFFSGEKEVSDSSLKHLLCANRLLVFYTKYFFPILEPSAEVTSTLILHFGNPSGGKSLL